MKGDARLLHGVKETSGLGRRPGAHHRPLQLPGRLLELQEGRLVLLRQAGQAHLQRAAHLGRSIVRVEHGHDDFADLGVVIWGVKKGKLRVRDIIKDGGLASGRHQPAPDPAFDAAGNLSRYDEAVFIFTSEGILAGMSYEKGTAHPLWKTYWK